MLFNNQLPNSISAGLTAVGDYRLLGLVPLRSIFMVSDKLGKSATST
jgi:hypothetical protein